MCRQALQQLRLKVTVSYGSQVCLNALGAPFSVGLHENYTTNVFELASVKTVWIKIPPTISQMFTAPVVVPGLPTTLTAYHGQYTNLSFIQLNVTLPASLSSCVKDLVQQNVGLWVEVQVTVSNGTLIMDANELSIFNPTSFKLHLSQVNILINFLILFWDSL